MPAVCCGVWFGIHGPSEVGLDRLAHTLEMQLHRLIETGGETGPLRRGLMHPLAGSLPENLSIGPTTRFQVGITPLGEELPADTVRLAKSVYFARVGIRRFYRAAIVAIQGEPDGIDWQ